MWYINKIILDDDSQYYSVREDSRLYKRIKKLGLYNDITKVHKYVDFNPDLTVWQNLEPMFDGDEFFEVSNKIIFITSKLGIKLYKRLEFKELSGMSFAINGPESPTYRKVYSDYCFTFHFLVGSDYIVRLEDIIFGTKDYLIDGDLLKIPMEYNCMVFKILEPFDDLIERHKVIEAHKKALYGTNDWRY